MVVEAQAALRPLHDRYPMDNVPVEIWKSIIDFALHDSALWEPSVVDYANLNNRSRHKPTIDATRSPIRSFRLVCKGWNHHIITSYRFAALPGHTCCLSAWSLHTPLGTYSRNCGVWDHTAILNVGRFDYITTMMIWRDEEQPTWDRDDIHILYRHLSNLPLLSTLSIYIICAFDDRIHNQPLDGWLALERVKLPKLAFLDFEGINMPLTCIIPLELPVLVELAMDDLGSTGLVRDSLPHILERHGSQLQIMSLNNNYSVHIPPNLATLVPKLQLLCLDMRAILLSEPDNTLLPAGLQKLVHTHEPNAGLWSSHMVQSIVQRKPGWTGIRVVEVRGVWDKGDKPDITTGVNRFAEVGVRMQDRNGNLWWRGNHPIVE